MSVTIPTSHNPPFALLALASLQGVPVTWDPEAGDKGEAKYGEVVGTEQVRAELEKNISGKEVSSIIHSLEVRGGLTFLSRFLYLLFLRFSAQPLPFKT